LAKAASDKLLGEHDIYVQSINYPTVAVGEERLRITVTQRHTVEQMDRLVASVNQVFTELNIKRVQDWKLAGGRCGVGMDNVVVPEPMWNDEQLGLTNGTAPVTLRQGEKDHLDALGTAAARSRFNKLLGPVNGPVQANRIVDGGAVVNAAITNMRTGGKPLTDMPLRLVEDRQIPVF